MKKLLLLTHDGIGLFNRMIGWSLAALLLVMTVLIFWQVSPASWWGVRSISRMKLPGSP